MRRAYIVASEDFVPLFLECSPEMEQIELGLCHTSDLREHLHTRKQSLRRLLHLYTGYQPSLTRKRSASSKSLPFLTHTHENDLHLNMV